MAEEIVELGGHIIDSLTLPKVLDEITAGEGRFEILELEVGRRREEASRARLRVEAETDARLDAILDRIQELGARRLHESEARLEPAPADGVFPKGFFVSSNQPTSVQVHGQWLPVRPARMDCGIAVDPEAGSGATRRFSEVRQGELVVVGRGGVRVQPVERTVGRSDAFEFMASSVSSEKPKGAAIRAVAQAMREARAAGEPVLMVAGPAIVHTGAAPHVVRMIEQGYVQRLFAGNALAVHDLEMALYGTALGIHLDRGAPIEHGHEHHIHTINRIRRAGSITAAVEQGLVTSGIMHACVRHGVEVVLAGSIRDDGPLPGVITDAVEAQRAMAARVEGVRLALMIATMLHSIAVGNMLPATTRIVCVDINPAVVTKLADRGSFQSIGIVTDVEPFFGELVAALG